MINRRSLLLKLASATTVLAAAPVYSKTPGFIRGAGDVRKIRFRNFVNR